VRYTRTRWRSLQRSLSPLSGFKSQVGAPQGGNWTEGKGKEEREGKGRGMGCPVFLENNVGNPTKY